MSRLQVRVLNMYPPSQCNTALYWNGGVMLFHIEARILIRLLPDTRQIELFVRGTEHEVVAQVYCNIMEVMPFPSDCLSIFSIFPF